jgi:hypothetical protein
MARYIVQIEPLASVEASIIAFPPSPPTIHHHLTGDLSRAGW